MFIESDKPAVDFIVHAFPVVHKLKDIYRFLYYGDRYDIAMRDDERVALSKVFGKDHCIEISAGFKEGDSVRVISGSLVNCESKILRINKNQKTAIIALVMFGSIIEVSVGFDIIERI